MLAFSLLLANLSHVTAIVVVVGIDIITLSV